MTVVVEATVFNAVAFAAFTATTSSPFVAARCSQPKFRSAVTAMAETCTVGQTAASDFQAVTGVRSFVDQQAPTATHVDLIGATRTRHSDSSCKLRAVA